MFLFLQIKPAWVSACERRSSSAGVINTQTLNAAADTKRQRSSTGVGWAQYGWCASHSQYFRGLRLHLIATPAGLPATFAVSSAKTNGREVCIEMIAHAQIAQRSQILIADKGYRGLQITKPTTL